TAAPAAFTPPEPTPPVHEPEPLTPPAFEPPAYAAPSFEPPAIEPPAFETAAAPHAVFEPPAPIPLASFEPAPIEIPQTPAFSLAPAIPLARTEPNVEPDDNLASDGGFEPRSSDWLAIGLTLAAAPLHDRPVGTSSDPGRLDDFRRMDAQTHAAVANGDF